MAIDLYSSYPTRANAPDSDYTYGSAKDAVTPGTGTPNTQHVWNDVHGFLQGLLATAGIDATGDPDTIVASQYRDALEALILRVMSPYLQTPAVGQSLSDRIGGIYKGDDRLMRIWSSANRIDTTSFLANGPRHLCRGWNYTLNKECIFVCGDDGDSAVMQITNDIDFQITGESKAITLPANHTPDSMACDGTSLYLLCHSAASGTAGAVHRFALDPWTGTPVWSHLLSGAIDDSRMGRSVIEIADDTRIVVLFNGAVLDTGIPALAVMLKANGSETLGSGNHSPSGSKYGGMGLCIVGSDIWFITRTSGYESSWVCGAQITSPTSDPTSPAFPDDINVSETVGRITTDGKIILLPHTDGGISVFNPSDAPVEALQANYFNVPNASFETNYPGAAFDGQRAWTLWVPLPANHNAFFFLFAMDDLYIEDASVRTIDYPRSIIGYPESTSSLVEDSQFCFAGGCLWLISNINQSGGYIRRVPRLGLRY